ncbi:MAG: ABC transporter permease [Phototrophicales bacterium]|nr:ABC transporter permease [Phototrophicales bacterium]
MSKILQIARREYNYNIRKPSFLFAAFGTPLIIIGLWVLLFAFSGNTTERPAFSRVGMIDTVGIINPDVAVDNISFEIIPYTDEASASADLDTEQIEAYFVLPEGFKTSGILPIYAYKELPNDFQYSIRRLILANISAEAGVTMPLDRILNPFNEINVQILDSGRTVNDAGIVFTFLAPFFFSLLFWISMQTTGNFLMNGLVEEKKNRIIEILVTTTTPTQLLMGKILGLGLLGLTQIGLWLGAALLALTVGPKIEFLSGLGNVQLPLELITAGFLFFGLGYLFNAGLLAGVGVLAGNEQQSNQYSAFILLPGYLPPIFLIGEFISNSNGSTATLLSMIPITAPFSMVMRIGFGAVPPEQIVISLGILLVSTIIVSWAAGKVFRWGLLLYGKKIRIPELLRVVTSRKVTYATSATLSESGKGAE